MGNWGALWADLIPYLLAVFILITAVEIGMNLLSWASSEVADDRGESDV